MRLSFDDETPLPIIDRTAIGYRPPAPACCSTCIADLQRKSMPQRLGNR